MLSVSQALSIIKSSIKPIKREYINVLEAKGRTLVSSIKSNTFSPPFNMSAMDGYAIKHKINGKSNKFKVVDEIFAGENKNNKILSGQAIRVFTGSRVPIGTNCVVMQENVSKTDKNHILINYNKLNEDYIRKKGQDFKKGSIV